MDNNQYNMNNNQYNANNQNQGNVPQRSLSKNLVILVLSIVNFALFFLLGGLIFSIFAVVLFVFAIKGVKEKDVKAIISLIINIITIAITVVAFVFAFKVIKTTFDSTKATAFETSVRTVIAEAEEINVINNESLSGTIECRDLITKESANYNFVTSLKTCTLNFDDELVSINVEGAERYKGYCIYNKNINNVKAEECK